jgi:hypothetical protein
MLEDSRKCHRRVSYRGDNWCGTRRQTTSRTAVLIGSHLALLSPRHEAGVGGKGWRIQCIVVVKCELRSIVLIFRTATELLGAKARNPRTVTCLGDVVTCSG